METPYLDYAIRMHEQAIKMGMASDGAIEALKEFKAIKLELNKVKNNVALGDVSGAKRKVCPVCKKTFKKGWGEFCSQDCWDTDM